MKRRKIKAVDLFCGAGGASTGLVRACKEVGYGLDLLAINHWPVAVETHSVNHPNVVHLCESIESVNPLQKEFVDPRTGRIFKNTGRLDVLLAGPECTHFSTARGGRPVNPQSRASAWHILKWAQELYIDVILIENVPEFRSWAPIGVNHKPLKSKKGHTYNAYLEALRSLGYRLEDRVLNFADYGDPTTRRRLFIFAIRNTSFIPWPAQTHAKRIFTTGAGQKIIPWQTARDRVIDWSVKGKNIFERDKPLRPETMLRIIAGLEKFGGPRPKPFLQQLRVNCVRTYVTEEVLSTSKPLQSALFNSTIANQVLCLGFLARIARLAGLFLRDEAIRSAHSTMLEPFLVVLRNNVSAKSIDEPISTLTGAGTHHALVDATLVAMEHGGRSVDPESPLPTITCAKGGAFGVAQACLVHCTHGGRENNIDAPIPTITGAHRGEIGLAQAYVLGQQSNANLRPDTEPLPTIAAAGAISLIEPFLTSAGGPEGQGRTATSVDEPVPTLLAKNHRAIIESEIRPVNDAVIVDTNFGRSHEASEARVRSIDKPVGVLPGSNRFGVTEAALVPLYSEREGQQPRSHSVDEPVPTIPATGSGKFGVAESFIVPQRRFDDETLRVDSVDNPLRTITGTGGRCFRLAQPYLTKFYGTEKGAQSIDEPVHTVTAKERHALVEPIIVSAGGPNVDARPVSEPLNTVLTRDHMALAETLISPHRSNSALHSTKEPVPTLTGSEHMALVDKRLEPIPTVTGANRLGLVESQVVLNSRPRKSRKSVGLRVRLEAPVIDGYVLVILFRMLRTKELARAMSFPDDYEFVGSQEDVVKQIGNAWAGELSKALCKAAIMRLKKNKVVNET